MLAFARVRELLGFTQRDLVLSNGATAGDAWRALVEGAAALDTLAASTRLARNGTVVDRATPLADGDELALLPPSGGG